MIPIRILFTALLVAAIADHSFALSPETMNNHATYRLIGSTEHREPPAVTVEITIGPEEVRDGVDLRWWELKINKDKGVTFRCQFLSDAVPMFRGPGMPTVTAAYRLEEPDHPAVEYVDAETGLALLPRFQFMEDFVPRPLADSRVVEGFINAGRYLGHAITLQTSEIAQEDWKPIEAKTLVMNRNLLIGTSRTVRDDGRTPKQLSDDYWYKAFKEEDYAELIAAGHNLFLAGEGLMNQLYDQPVFFIANPWKLGYPELFYRSSYQGPSMYIDEPAVRSGGTLWKAEVRQLDAAAEFITNYTATQINGAMERPRDALDKQGAALGTIDITDRDIASWDTVMETAFYQFKTGVGGLVHENRAKLADYNKVLPLYFGPGLEVTRDEMLYLQNAVMRGAARNFGKSWGTSIYGQMEEETRIPCVIKAYDMGARYIWFWTSDHDHHVPFKDQLAIARALTDHAKVNPRRPVSELLKKAETVITIPHGYLMTLDNYLYPQGALWAINRFSLTNKNPAGIYYKDILAAAMWEGVQCLRQGEDFDFAIETEGFNPEGYKRIVRVLENGEVMKGRNGKRPGRLIVTVEKTGEPAIGSATKAMKYSSVTPRIDGELSDWDGGHWISLNQIRSATGEWPEAEPDLSARFAFAADRDNFYLAAEVRDDVHSFHRDYPNVSGDMIEVVIDPFLNQGDRFRSDDLAIALALTEKGPSAWCGVAGFSGNPGEFSESDVHISRTTDGRTIYEAGVPLDLLPPLDPLARSRHGINFAVMDINGERGQRYVQWAEGLREGWRMPEKWGVIAWSPPENAQDLPLRAQFDVVRSAGSPGDAWSFTMTTAAGEGRDAFLRAELSVAKGAPVKKEIPVQLKGNQNHAISIETTDIRPGRYELTLTLDCGDDEPQTRTVPVYLFDAPRD